MRRAHELFAATLGELDVRDEPLQPERNDESSDETEEL